MPVGLSIFGALFLASTAVVGGLSPVRAACDVYPEIVRWSEGDATWHYIPGGLDQGSYDLPRAGNLLVLPEVDTGVFVYTILPNGGVQQVGHLACECRPYAAAAWPGYAVLAVEGPALIVVDLSDPTQPEVVATLPGIPATAFAVDPPYLYAVAYEGISILSIADPGDPRLVGTLEGDALGIAVDGSRAYVSRISGLWVADVSDPADPEYLGPVYPTDNAYDLAVRGGWLYMAQTAAGLRVFDLTDPDAPAPTALVPFTGGHSLAVDPPWAILGGDDRFLVVDIAQPAAPQAGAVWRGAGAHGGGVVDGRAYLAAGHYGLQVYDLGSGNGPVARSVDLARGARDLRPFGTRIAMLSGFDLVILDAADPWSPQPLSSLALETPGALEVNGSHAFVSGLNGLTVVSLADPSDPEIVGSVDAGIWGEAIAVAGARAYIGNLGGRVYTLDVSDPTQPAWLAVQNLQWSIEAVAAAGTSLYTLQNFEGTSWVTHWDMSDPNAPVRLGEFFEAGPLTRLRLLGDDLLVAGPYALHRVDAATLERRETIGDHNFGSSAILEGPEGRVLGAAAPGGFHVFENRGAGLSLLASGAAPTPGASGVAQVAGVLYLANASGLHLFDAACTTSGAAAPAATLPEPVLRAAPNPAPGATRLSWDGLGAGASAVRVELYDASGRHLRTLAALDASGRASGSVEWDGRDASGRPVAAGIVFARLRGGSEGAGRVITVVR